MTFLQEQIVLMSFYGSLCALPLLHMMTLGHWNMRNFSVAFQFGNAILWAFFIQTMGHEAWVPSVIPLFEWLSGLTFNLYIDRVAGILALMIACVSSCVQLYSIGYIDRKESPRFFWQLSFFSTMMQALVLAGNYLMLFLSWEGIGVASFLLIGFARDGESLKNSTIAVVANRMGDLGLLFGLIGLYTVNHSLDYGVLLASTHLVEESIVFALFLGIVIKSAQWPFHVWLPGSMSAPTPVSALLHAATLVTAGVYLFMRILPMIPETSQIFIVMQMLSCTTILWMGFIAIFQVNIKKLIAYSTISQLGYMILAMSLRLPHLGLFHLWTHGFFKALLFLCAGIATHRAHGSQKLSDLRGIFTKDRFMIVITLIALCSLAGVPGFAGFYSKERIIHWVVTHEIALWIQISVIGGAITTAIYCGRLAAILIAPSDLVFKSHETDVSFRIALILLAGMTLICGPLGESEFFGILNSQDSANWKFLKESMETGWVLVISGIFFIVFRLLRHLNSAFFVFDSVQKVLKLLEKEWHYPATIVKIVSKSFHILATGFHTLQKKYIEEGLAKSALFMAKIGSAQISHKNNSNILLSIRQSGFIGLGLMLFCLMREYQL